ncbi:uncharacterized protein LOC111246511 isoform X2 [Varroa destructor]|uniref:Uncharacterized protein n=1 Tax=Varroa destructor TaxID=109461 RepID=A0A7M7JHF1_VARDE|nr:uncharacterized protein LOC111246511 isoform X2 [Varroa destructor]XP_022651986.1 uncharacterized protein LOC111246511 isoform X2 [Varroa destructor]
MEEPLLKRRYRPLGKPGLGSAIAHAVPVVVGAAVKNPGFFRNFIYANPPFAGPAIRDAVNMAFRRRVLTRVRGSLEIYEYWKDIRLNRNTDPDMNVPNENTFDTSFTSRFIEIKFSPKELYKKKHANRQKHSPEIRAFLGNQQVLVRQVLHYVLADPVYRAVLLGRHNLRAPYEDSGAKHSIQDAFQIQLWNADSAVWSQKKAWSYAMTVAEPPLLLCFNEVKYCSVNITRRYRIDIVGDYPKHSS